VDEKTTTQPETLEEIRARRFLRNALTVRAAGLRKIGDELDRLAKQVDTTASYSLLAETALHAVMWGLANLHLELIIHEAASADVTRAKKGG
jgi:hypothetical protein